MKSVEVPEVHFGRTGQPDAGVCVASGVPFCTITTHRLGVGIDTNHHALAAGRVAKRLALLQVGVDEYMSRLDDDRECSEVVGFLDVLRPRAPRFFARRDDHMALCSHLVDRLKDGGRRLRLWSAGCGSGEEGSSCVTCPARCATDISTRARTA